MTNEEVLQGLIEQSENATELFKKILAMIEENRKAIQALNKAILDMTEAHQLY